VSSLPPRSDERVKRYALLGSQQSVDAARDSAAAVFGEIFEPYQNDSYGGYWLGHWHIPSGESKWFGDDVKICENVIVDENGKGPKETLYPDTPTLLYVEGSKAVAEQALVERAFSLLHVTQFASFSVDGDSPQALATFFEAATPRLDKLGYAVEARGYDWGHWTRGFTNVIRVIAFKDGDEHGLRVSVEGEHSSDALDAVFSTAAALGFPPRDP
jgi:hypothetical protein